MVLALVAAAIRVLMRMPERVAARQPEIADRLFVYGNATAQVLRMRGEKVKPGETPLLFARRMDKTMAAKVPITPLWRSMLLCNYSRRTPTDVLVEQARSIFRGVYKPQPFYVKLRFMLSAALKPSFYRLLTTQVAHETPAGPFAAPAAKAQKGKQQRDDSLFRPGEAERRRMEQQSLEIERSVREMVEQMEADSRKAAQEAAESPRRTRTKPETGAAAPVQPPESAAAAEEKVYPANHAGAERTSRRRRRHEDGE